jgi:mono/diheme cytochrome c family protein
MKRFPPTNLRAGKFKGTIFVMPYLLLLCLIEFACAIRSLAVAPGEPLVWESPAQNYTVKPGEVTAHFTFKVSNVSASEVIIDDVKPSCGCTLARMPGKPWHLAPKENSKMEVLVDLRGKTGVLFKEIEVLSSNAPKLLTVMVNIPAGVTNGMTTEMINRIWGQELAATDHQAVFKKDCVKCHLEPAFGRSGQPLYKVACGICHEAKHRATMVPDLHALKTEIGPDYWRNWVTHGKPGTLMPGFAATEGGPLDSAQITSLVDYLSKAFPRPMKSSTASKAEK